MKRNTKILTLVFVVAFLTLLVGCLTPPNQTPIITSTPVTTATVGVLYTYDVNATDPDGDTLTYSLVAKPMGMTINSASGLIKWTPVATQVGDNSVIVKVSDGSLSIGQRFTIKVSTLPPVNQAPVIISTPVTTAIVGVTYVYDVNATDPDGDTLTYSLTNKPSGMAINPTNGLIWWIPTSAQAGNNLVTVNAYDGALSDTQSFVITVSAVEPEAEPEIELTGIVVDPKTMNLVVGESETIESVTATYEIKGTEVTIALGECDYVPDPTGVVTVNDGLVEAIAEGTATVIVGYGGETDTLEVTVEAVEPTGPVHNITKDIYYDAIQEAIDAADDNDTIHVANGMYNATTANSTEWQNNPDEWWYVIINKPLELVGESRDGVILDGTGLQGQNRATGIWVSASNVIVKNLTIQNFEGPPNFSYGLYIMEKFRDYVWGNVETLQYVTAENLKIVNCQASLYFMKTEYATVKDCIVEDSTADGIWVAWSCDYATIQDNTVLNSGDHGIWVGTTWFGPPGSNNTTIIDNYIDGAREGGISFVGSDVATISGNTITNAAGEGWSKGALSLKDGSSNVDAYNNNIYNNSGVWSGYNGTGHGIGIDGIPSNIYLYHNNIYGNTGDGIHNYSNIIVDATRNWWGDASGPGGVGPGTGDAVSADVDFDPWSTTPH